MPKRYQNGIDLSYVGSNYASRTFSRWMFEFLTKVVGWSVVDIVSGTGWDNYVAQGSTASTTDSETILITSAGYAFSSTDVDSYLTITGFSSPNDVRDGIYKIEQVTPAGGDDYSVRVNIIAGVHEDGLPVGASSLNWYLWRGDATYTPTAANVAVLEGTGYTGAGLNIGTGTGDSITMAGSLATLDDAAANFQTSDVGKYVTISGASNGGNNGKFQITARNSATQIEYTNASGVTETSAFTWAISYPFHLHIELWTSYQYPPIFRISPFASWNSGTHTWNDNRYTGQVYLSHSNWYIEYKDRYIVQAEADLDHITVSFTADNFGGYITPGFISIGEIDTFYPLLDPNPILIHKFQQIDQARRAFGTYYDAGYGSFNGYGLSWDDETTLTYRMMYHHTAANYTSNFMLGSVRARSKFSDKLYRLPLFYESVTAGHTEIRGKARYAWITGHGNAGSTPFGANLEYMHGYYGYVFPWNGSRSGSPALPRTYYIG